MGIFATRRRADATGDPEARGELSEEQRRPAAALRGGGGGPRLGVGRRSTPARSSGRELARDGVVAGRGARRRSRRRRCWCCGAAARPTPRPGRSRSPGARPRSATCTSLSCEDPLTGLASLAHLRSRVAELYRGSPPAAPGAESHALVVVDRGRGPATAVATRTATTFGRARCGSPSSATPPARSSPGARPSAGVGPDRVVVLAGRDDGSARRVGLLRRDARSTPGQRGARVWIEGLPGTDAAAAALLDELARA